MRWLSVAFILSHNSCVNSPRAELLHQGTDAEILKKIENEQREIRV